MGLVITWLVLLIKPAFQLFQLVLLPFYSLSLSSSLQLYILQDRKQRPLSLNLLLSSTVILYKTPTSLVDFSSRSRSTNSREGRMIVGPLLTQNKERPASFMTLTRTYNATPHNNRTTTNLKEGRLVESWVLITCSCLVRQMFT